MYTRISLNLALAFVLFGSLQFPATSLGLFQGDPIRLTHGPMLGHVTDNSVRVWCRTSKPGSFKVHLGLATDSLIARQQEGQTRIEDDNTGAIEVSGLQPDTKYHYQVWVNERPHGLPGSFRTLPSKEDSRNEKYNPQGLFNFRFEIGSCANQNPLHGIGHRAPTYENLNRDWADKVNFHIMNGDWLYEEQREFPAEAWRLTQGVESLPSVVEIMPTVVGVWENYKLYLSRGNDLSLIHI